MSVVRMVSVFAGSSREKWISSKEEDLEHLGAASASGRGPGTYRSWGDGPAETLTTLTTLTSSAVGIGAAIEPIVRPRRLGRVELFLRAIFGRGLCVSYALKELRAWDRAGRPGPEMRLVLGEVRGFAAPVEHAWIERGGFAYCWSTLAVHGLQPLPEHEYLRRMAARRTAVFELAVHQFQFTGINSNEWDICPPLRVAHDAPWSWASVPIPKRNTSGPCCAAFARGGVFE
jgi:hypothetical protein